MVFFSLCLLTNFEISNKIKLSIINHKKSIINYKSYTNHSQICKEGEKNMFAEERRLKIVEIINRGGDSVKVSQLAKKI